MEAMKGDLIDWGVAARALAGETESGDRCLVKRMGDGALLAVADGLGHGAEAAMAAELAIRTVEAHALRPLTEIVEACHRVLLRTRGAALSLAHWNAERRDLTWVGVGNVEGLLLKEGSGSRPDRERLVLRHGVVGDRLPALQASTVPVPGEGILILATDGIADGFDQSVEMRAAAQPQADGILARHSRDADDALVLVARLGR
ncbi:MAG TPA: SpoIIE family protein phosphatase [Candidatus Polarisedimenticolia bacterium]|jgi:serine/threonine protein phosphatase PrpC|nr:SpoIIE family protein phosphatase [Candidatus Polarisedimenticolia bacterium]